ncbi:MAG: diphthamide biosynthesis enzyme Dph2 [Desulfurococcaceae archaeon]
MNDICSIYDVEYSVVEGFLRENRVEKILIQAPDGLKKIVPCILNKVIDKNKYRVYVSSSPTYGGCDLALDEAIRLNVDLIIHIGHNEYPYLSIKPNIPVLYIPAYYNWKPGLDLINNIVETLSRENVSSIGLVATIQHIRSINELSHYLEERGFEVHIGKSDNPSLENGQIIGCNYSSASSIDKYVDAYIVLAGGMFHAIGLSLTTSKRVYGIDPYKNVVWNTREFVKKVIAKRMFLVSMLRNSGFRTIGLIIGLKPGQYRPSIIEYLIKLSEENNIEYYVIQTSELNNDRLIAIDNALSLDVYVVTSCPRLPIDDLSDFYKPVLTPGEYVMVLNRACDKYIYPW